MAIRILYHLIFVAVATISIDLDIFYYGRPYSFIPRLQHNCSDSSLQCFLTQNPQHRRHCSADISPDGTIRIAVVTFTAWRNQDICSFRPNITLVESLEPTSNFRFRDFSRHFDGVSTTSPSSDIPQRLYSAIRPKELRQPLRDHSQLVPGAAYIQGRCFHYNGSVYRNEVVRRLRSEGIRVDGLGTCMHTPVGPEGVHLGVKKNTNFSSSQDVYDTKMSALSRYMFDISFENAVEPGWLTEKVMHALRAGSAVHLFISQIMLP